MMMTAKANDKSRAEGKRSGRAQSSGGNDASRGAPANGALVEYRPGTTFPGIIGRTADVSSPAWPSFVRAQGGARTRKAFHQRSVGEQEFPYTIPLTLGLAAGVSVGRDEGAPMTDEYRPPFEFTGRPAPGNLRCFRRTRSRFRAEMKQILARQ